jgi:hypothetical protein
MATTHGHSFEDEANGWRRGVLEHADRLNVPTSRASQLIAAFIEYGAVTAGALQPSVPRVPRSSQRRNVQPGTLRGLLADKTVEANSDLLEGIINGCAAGGLIAAPKAGKTMLAMRLGLAVAMDAGEFLGRKLKGGSVLFLALEMTPAQFRARAEAMLAGADAPGDFHVLTRGQIARMEHGGLDELRHAIVSIQPQLVVIDTWAAFREMPNGQSLYDADYRSVDALRALAAECRTSILFCHHSGKRSRGRDPSSDAIATHGLGAGASFLLALDHRPDSAKAWLVVSGNEVAYARIPLKWDAEALAWQLADHKEGRRDDVRRAAEDWLRVRLSRGPVLATEIVNAAKAEHVCGERTLRAIKAALGIKSEPASGPKSRWRLP